MCYQRVRLSGLGTTKLSARMLLQGPLSHTAMLVPLGVKQPSPPSPQSGAHPTGERGEGGCGVGVGVWGGGALLCPTKGLCAALSMGLWRVGVLLTVCALCSPPCRSLPVHLLAHDFGVLLLLLPAESAPTTHMCVETERYLAMMPYAVLCCVTGPQSWLCAV